MENSNNNIKPPEASENIVKAFKTYLLINNNISDSHFKSLYFAPFIFFDNVKEVKLDYDLVPLADKKTYLPYYIVLNTDAQQDEKWEARKMALINTAKQLSWDNTEIKLFFNRSGADNVK